MADSAELRIVSVGDSSAPMVGSVPPSIIPPNIQPINQPQPPAPSQVQSPASRQAPPVQPPKDELIESLLGLRGVLGGIFGPLAGAVLDVVAAFKKLKTEAKPIPDIWKQSFANPKWIPPVAGAPSPQTAAPAQGSPAPTGGAPQPTGWPSGTSSWSTPTTASAQAAAQSATPPTQSPISRPNLPPIGHPAGFGPAPRTPSPSFSPTPQPQVAASQFANVQAAQIVPPEGAPITNIAGTAAAGLSAAAIPIAIGVAVMKALEVFKDELYGAVKGLGSFTATLISPDTNPSVAINAMGKAVGGVSDKLFWINPVLGTLGKVAGGAAEGLSAITDTFHGMAERYGQVNPQIAVANAQSELRLVMGDIRRGNEAGPALARYVESETRLREKIEDLKIRILIKLEPLITIAVGRIEAGVDFLQVLIDLVTGLTAEFQGALTGNWLPLSTAIFEAISRAQRQNAADIDLPTDQFLRGFPFTSQRGEGGVARPESQ